MPDTSRRKQLASLRRIRLLRAQRELQALLQQRRKWQQALDDDGRHRELHHAAQLRCLHRADPTAPDHALVMAAAAAHARSASALSMRIDNALREMGALAAAVEAALTTLRKAQHLHDRPLPAPRRRAAAGVQQG
ncbi:MAG TPA: hypothetical protein VD865_00870 [Stenotrophomonas sp.]|nr:hypothetical protein [Stenotrophomonas sp.]